jgi:Cu-Zn family superoxide dismutase
MLCALVLGTTARAANKDDDEKIPINKAIAVLSPTQGSKVTGIITFKRLDNGGMKVTGHVEGLTPGDHGFHIHEFGDCSAADGASAGGHFNPEGHNHAGPEVSKRHEGDLGNLTADSHGVAKYDRVFPDMKFRGQNGIVGRGIIVHEKADDLKTQPTGGAGARVACGVIGVAKD